MTWYVYLLRCQDGSQYTGITTDLTRRMNEHQNGEGSKYVQSRGYKYLAYAIRTRDRSEATRVEQRVKDLQPDEKQPFFHNHNELAYQAIHRLISETGPDGI